MRNVLKRTDKYFWFATAIIAAGCAVRLFALGSIPCGLNQDEAFAGYNAWALLHYGVDSSGYHNPVYFTAWGSGMNALESYLMIPFVALFGTGTAVLRLPQALMACLSLICVYDLGKHISGRRFALCAVAVLATSPWHIMMARWALESNLSPAFLLLWAVFLCAWVIAWALAVCQCGSLWFQFIHICYNMAHRSHSCSGTSRLCAMDEKAAFTQPDRPRIGVVSIGAAIAMVSWRADGVSA